MAGIVAAAGGWGSIRSPDAVAVTVVHLARVRVRGGDRDMAPVRAAAAKAAAEAAAVVGAQDSKSGCIEAADGGVAVAAAAAAAAAAAVDVGDDGDDMHYCS